MQSHSIPSNSSLALQGSKWPLDPSSLKCADLLPDPKLLSFLCGLDMLSSALQWARSAWGPDTQPVTAEPHWIHGSNCYLLLRLWRKHLCCKKWEAFGAWWTPHAQFVIALHHGQSFTPEQRKCEEFTLHWSRWLHAMQGNNELGPNFL